MRLTAALLLAPAVAQAQQPEPYVVLAVGTSASMQADVCGAADVDDTLECAGADVTCAPCGAIGCENAVADDGRLWKAKRAARQLVESFGEMTFALARFHQNPAPFSCKGGGWSGASAGCAGDAVGAGENRADILVGLGDGTEDQILSWLDGCDDWPTAADCDPVASLAPDTGCLLCPDCGAGCDQELRPDGDAPLGGSLFSIRQYLQGVMTADPRAPCRTYAVMLFSDATNTCSGDAVAETTALCSWGIPTVVVGYDDPALLPDLQAMASAGCGPTCATGPSGASLCDGQVILTDDDTALSLAVQRITQGSWLAEVCNGQDDDCDDLWDEDFTSLGDSCCDPCPGTIVCTPSGDGVMCAGAGSCPEICNDRDDDCDGLVDEDILPPCEPAETCDPGQLGLPCGIDEGACEPGVTCCDGTEIGCCGADGPYPEICDCLDNNCDGQTDEVGSRVCYDGPPSECPDPQSGACVGLCLPGTQPCSTDDCPSAPGFGPCVGQLGPRPEVCNCLDDDCDGDTDDGATCPGGGPCVDCTCLPHCDGEFPCPVGYFCSTGCVGLPQDYCFPDRCIGLACAWDEYCETCTGECRNACEVADCGDRECCGGVCCTTWQTCRDADGDGVATCDDTSCTSPDFPCAQGQACVDHDCVPGEPPLAVGVGGGGGCECHAAGEPSAPKGWPLALLALLARGRRGYRRRGASRALAFLFLG